MDKKPPFSPKGLAVPERDKLQMNIKSRKKMSFCWAQAEQIAGHVRKMDGLGDAQREQYATLFLLAAASGLRCSELLALKANNLDFEASAIRVEESSDQRSGGRVGPYKNATAYRTVLLLDLEGQKAMRELLRFLNHLENNGKWSPTTLVFRSKRGGPLLETTVLNQGLYAALKALQIEQGGLHAFLWGFR
jgi:integrase